MTKTLAREGAARHRRREWRGGLLRHGARRLRRAGCAAADPAAARWCACARSSWAWAPAARRRCCPLPPARDRPRRLQAQPQARCRPSRAACPCPSLIACAFGARRWRPRAAEPRLRRRSADRSAPAGEPLYNSFGTPCSRPGTPSGKTGLRSPGSFFLVSRKSSRSVGSKLLRPLEQPASAPDSAIRTAAAIRRCERRMVDFSLNSFSAVSSSRPAEATPAALRRASAGSAASRRHWQS